MGGNATGHTQSGKETKAQKIPLKKIGRKVFVDKITKLLKFINKDFEKIYKEKLWKDETQIANGFVFNGSTSFIMNQEYSDDDILMHKPLCGDLDIAVPEYLKVKLFNYLRDKEEKEMTPDVKYMGSNKPTIESIGHQINCVFLIDFEIDGKTESCACQVDWELLPFSETGIPTQWAKFSHSSSFDDCKAGIKAVHHKYLLRALVGGASTRTDIVVATNKSTWDNVIISKAKTNLMPRMLKFSVDYGLRVAYEPLLDPNGKNVFVDGKQVFKEIPTKNSTYVTDVGQIFLLTMKPVDLEDAKKSKDEEKMWSFLGVLDLMKKYCSDKQIKDTYNRYIELLWGLRPSRAQELEIGDSEGDYKVKIGGYLKFIEHFKLKDESQKICPPYYETYGQRGKITESVLESFETFWANKEYVQEYY
jgi:hypothetical protein